VGQESSLGIASHYMLKGPGIEPVQTGEGSPHSLLQNGYGVFPVDKAAGAWR